MAQAAITFDDLPTVATPPPVAPVEVRPLPPVEGTNSRGEPLANTTGKGPLQYNPGGDRTDLTFDDLPSRKNLSDLVSEGVGLPDHRSLVDDIAGYFANANRGIGYGDELSAGLHTAGDIVTGHSGPDVVQTYKDEMGRQRAMEDGFRAAHPVLAANALALGNTALMAAPVGPGAEAFMNGGRVVNALRGATLAATTGGAYALADRGSPGERVAAAERAVTDPVTLALGAALGGAAGSKPKAPTAEVPSLDELTAQKNAAYKAVDDSGVTYTPQAFRGLTEDMARALDDSGFNAGLHPKTAAMLQRLGESDRGAGGFAPTITQLDQLRQQIGRDLAASSDAGERRMGQILRGKIDDFIASAGPEAISGGNPAQAAALIDRARDLNTRVAKLRSLDNLDEAAADRAAVTGSGGNIDNATRQNALRFKTRTGNLTPDEQAATQRIIDGTPGQNALRLVGKLSPENGMLSLGGHLLSAGASHGATLPLAVGGMVSKHVADAITGRNVQALRDLIASGGEAAQEVSRQLADPAYAELRAQLANDLAAQAGVQGRALQAAGQGGPPR